MKEKKGGLVTRTTFALLTGHEVTMSFEQAFDRGLCLTRKQFREECSLGIYKPIPRTTLASAIDNGNVVEQKDLSGSNLINPYDPINLQFLKKKRAEKTDGLYEIERVCQVRLLRGLEVIDMILEQTDIDEEAWIVMKELLAFSIAR